MSNACEIEVNGVKYVPAESHDDKRLVIVRSRDAGVHIGRLVHREGTDVQLADARRLWRWKGANTLNEVANHGVDDDYSRISEPVAEITILSACEVIIVAAAAEENLTRSRWPA